MVNYYLIGFLLATLILYLYIYMVDTKELRTALDNTLNQLLHPEEGFLYLILAAFFLSNALLLILPKDLIAQWIGREAGFKGILIGTLVGSITPGGPFLTFPILVAFYRAGAAVGPLIAFLTSWSLLGLQRIFIWEIPFLGFNFVLVRVIISLGVPILLGLIGQYIFDTLKL